MTVLHQLVSILNLDLRSVCWDSAGQDYPLAFPSWCLTCQHQINGTVIDVLVPTFVIAVIPTSWSIVYCCRRIDFYCCHRSYTHIMGHRLLLSSH